MEEKSFFDLASVEGSSEHDEKCPVDRHLSKEEVAGKEMDACFTAFDKDEDQNLNVNEFTALLKALFRNEKGKPYPIDQYMCNELFTIFNKSGDGSMSKEEFTFCWNNWIKKIVRPVSALIIVDVQNDFISGTLAISNCPAGQDGLEVVEPINRLIDTVPFDLFCYSLDWHPTDHVSFVDNVHLRELDEDSLIKRPDDARVYDTVVFKGPPKTDQTLWPRHCVQESWGAELHKDLKIPKDSIMVYKGVHSFIESYSSFYDNGKQSETKLRSELQKAGITDAYICGLATDVCVAYTAFHAQEIGFRTVLIDDCSRGIQPEQIKKTFERVRANHGLVVHSSEVKAMVQGRDRRIELGYQLALECRKKIVYPLKNRNSKFNTVNPDQALADMVNSTSNDSNHNAIKASA